MAVQFSGDYTRTSEYLFDPADITVKAELNGRKNLPEIETLVQSFVSIGQLQPVLIGRDGVKPVLYTGHRRWRAALEVNKRKLTPKPFKLRCVYYEGDEKSAFLATVTENYERESTDEIDDANNIAIMKRWGMSEEEIATGVYHGRDVVWVKRRLALLDLCEEGAQAIRDGRMKTSAAVAIAKLSKKVQQEKIASVPSDQKITGAVVRVEASTNGSKPRRTSELREFWKPYAEREKTDKITRFAAAQLEYLAGGDAEQFFSIITALLK